MNMDGIKPDSLSVSSVLPACARTIARKNGKAIHRHLLGNGIDLNLIVQNATVDMYAKSELVNCALKVFERMKKRDAISWTVMILGFSLHGKGELGVELSRGMEKDQRAEIDQFTCVASCPPLLHYSLHG
ncbi:hypothetical protein NC651_000745 [Populus alba x Populus x berolinensis]|nr:hypothetical protein NC651_000745 [Populus alba x Populus x berolinensis]